MAYIHEFPHSRVVIHYHPTKKQFALDDVRFALNHKLHALELDLHLRRHDGQIVCNHDGPTGASPPLEQAVNLILEKKGDAATVYNDSRQFFLVLEPKSVSPALFNGILEILDRYAAHWSTAVAKEGTPRGITVVITGTYTHQFYEYFPPEQVNRLCLVEGHDYSDEITNLALGQPPFQWAAFRSPGERGRINNLHTGKDQTLTGRYNVRVWDCDPSEFALCLAGGADQVNCDAEHVETLKQIIQDHAVRGRFPALAIRESQALLTWQGETSNRLFVALGSVDGSNLKFSRQVVLTHFLADECLGFSPQGGLTGNNHLLIVYEALSDHNGMKRFWRLLSRRLPRWLAQLLYRPQSLRYVVGQFTAIERFVSFDGRERQLVLPSGTILCGRNPTVGFGPDGQVLIVYESTQELGLRFFSGSIQAKGDLIGQDSSLMEGEICVGYTPAIAVDRAGRVVVVYRGPQQGELYYLSGYLTPSGQIAGRRFSLSQGKTRRGCAPSVAMDGNGQILVAYQDIRDGRLVYLSGILDRSGRIHGQTFPIDEGKTRKGNHRTSVAFDRDGRAIILDKAPNGYGFRYLYGDLTSGRVVGELKPVRISAVHR